MDTGTSNTDLLDFAAILVSLLSALYARWAWAEAKKANEFSLYQHQKQIYDAFFTLKSHMTQQWDGADISEVAKFNYPSKNATFYFDKKLAKELQNYFSRCFQIADKNRTKCNREEHLNLIEQAKEAEKAASELERKLIDAVTVV